MTTQTEFAAAILDPHCPSPADLVNGSGRHAGRRFAVYRNNVAVSLMEALASGFPVIEKLLGTENFRALSGIFLRGSPPDDARMMYYGAGFPEFLERFDALAHLGYLGDVARLELALRRSYHAADAPQIAPKALARVPADALDSLRIDLAPSVQIVVSDWPILNIWRRNTLPDMPKPQARAQDVLITRPNFDPQLHALPAGGAAVLGALRHGATLGEAMSRAPDCDLAALLGLLLDQGAIAAIATPESMP